jgi:hypothetical protein
LHKALFGHFLQTLEFISKEYVFSGHFKQMEVILASPGKHFRYIMFIKKVTGYNPVSVKITFEKSNFPNLKNLI